MNISKVRSKAESHVGALMIISLLLGALVFAQADNIIDLAFPTYGVICKGQGTPTITIDDVVRWETEGNTTKFYSGDNWFNPGMAISGMSCLITKKGAIPPTQIPPQAAVPVLPFPFPPGIIGPPRLPDGHPKARSQKVIEEQPLGIKV